MALRLNVKPESSSISVSRIDTDQDFITDVKAQIQSEEVHLWLQVYLHDYIWVIEFLLLSYCKTKKKTSKTAVANKAINNSLAKETAETSSSKVAVQNINAQLSIQDTPIAEDSEVPTVSNKAIS